MAAEMRTPAPKAVRKSKWPALSFTNLPRSAPTKEVPPANAEMPITSNMSLILIGSNVVTSSVYLHILLTFAAVYLLTEIVALIGVVSSSI